MEPAGTAVKWSRGDWKRAIHLNYLSHKLMELVEKPLRLLVSVPPRHGKSELVSHWLPVWFIANWPSHRVIEVSYEADFASTWGRKARDTILGNSQGLGVKIREDIQATNAWETVEGGGMITAGVGGPITGRGANLLVIDDPIKNWEEAHSVTVREAIWNWYRSTARPRLEPEGSIVIMMARWHREDLIGRLLLEDKEPWDYFALPALAQKDDPLGRVVGIPLWPERYGLDALEKTRLDIGEDAWKSLYQQAPETVAGDCYFDIPAIQRLMETAREGPVFKPYVVGRRYGAGIDPAGEGADQFSLAIKDCQTGEYVVDYTIPGPLGEFALGAYAHLKNYQFPLLGIEATGVGLATVMAMKGLGYPPGKLVYRDEKREKVGMMPTRNIRDMVLVDFAEGVRQGSFVVYSKKALEEMLHFVKNPKTGKAGAAQGAHDDRVMAMAWADWVSRQVSIGLTTSQGHQYARL